MSILYLSYDGILDNLGRSQIVPYLNGLASNGWEITVISFEKKTANRDINKSGLKNSINWYPLRYHKTPPVLGTLIDVITLRIIAKRICNEKRISIVHCRSYIPSIVGLYLKKKYRIKFIFDMRGFWADERVEGGIWNLNNPLYKLIYKYFKIKEREFINHSDQIITLTESAKEIICSSYTNVANVHVIPTCVDMKLFDPQKIDMKDQLKLREKLGFDKDDFILLYLGSLGTWYLGKEMFDFFFYLKKITPNSKFLILSNESESGIFKIYSSLNEDGQNNYLLKSNIIVSNIDRLQVPLYISICDASVLFIKKSFSKKASSATKMGEIMAMGKLIISNSGWGDIDRIMSPSMGIVLNCFSKKDYQIAVDYIKKPFNSESIRSFAKSRFDLSIGVMKYHRIYESMLLLGGRCNKN